MKCVIVNKKEINKIQKGNKSIKNKKRINQELFYSIISNYDSLRLTTTQKRERRDKEVKLINYNPIPL